jgi:hypothetical protein
LGNLFIEVGNAQLRNKITFHTTDQKVLVVKTKWLNSLTVQEVCDKHVKRYKYGTYVYTEEVAGVAQEAVTRSPRKIV